MSARDAGAQVFRADVIFASELAEAKRKGFELQIGAGRKGVRARLVPLSRSARAACALIDAGSFEARCVVPEGADGIDAIREAIRAVIEHADQALA